MTSYPNKRSYLVQCSPFALGIVALSVTSIFVKASISEDDPDDSADSDIESPFGGLVDLSRASQRISLQSRAEDVQSLYSGS